jgi:16S rRNA (uracil1498-N3)-methyltransferase
VRVVDGAGTRGTGTLRRSGDGLVVEVAEVAVVPRPAPLVLGAGAGDRDRFAQLVEQATQLGATAIVPLETARTVNVASRVRDSHRDRLQRRADEAMKQCGTAWAPEVRAPMALAAWCAEARLGAAWLADAGGLPPSRVSGERALEIAVGPEGGFTPEEGEALRAAGFVPVCLGPHALTLAWQARSHDRSG